MNKNIKFWVFLALVALLSTGCSTENTSGQGKGDTSRPQPQVRVQAMPSATTSLLAPIENAAPSPEPTASATSAQVYFDPTPDEDALANQIETLMDEIDRKLKSENFLLK